MPYYIHGRSGFDAFFVIFSNGSVILYHYRTASWMKDSTKIFLMSLGIYGREKWFANTPIHFDLFSKTVESKVEV